MSFRLAWLALAALLLPPRHLHAEPFIAGATLDRAMVDEVVATGLAFIAPRTLQAFTLPQLSLWGLRGLATIDPRLNPELLDGELRLSLFATPAPRLLLARRLPSAEAAPAAWGDMLASLIRAAWDASQPVRRVGTDGIVEVFFDEICNHLDAYSRYVTPEAAEPDRDLRAGTGIELVPQHGLYVVGAVTADGPAAAEVHPGEVLLAVDGQSVAGATLDEVTFQLTGPEESLVLLRLRNRGRVREVTLTRALPVRHTVHSRRLGRLVVLQVSGFSPGTGEQLATALSDIAGPASADGDRGRKMPRGLVIDLRGNPGGLLREAVLAAGSLVAGGVLAVTIGRDPAADHEFRADGEDLARGLPVVVVVDGASASAAEVLAAALADQHRAVVVGSSTVGKGLVQAVGKLPNGGKLLLTWSRVIAPLGWPIQGLGVLPQLCTSLGDEAIAAQLADLAHGEPPMAGPLARHRAARQPVSSAETLAVRAACPAAEGRNADLAAARFLIDHPNAYSAALLGPPP